MLWTVIKITKKINLLREKIDEIDKKILSLILEREKIVNEVGKEKHNSKTRIYVPERENNIFKKLSNFFPISFDEAKNLYTEIISFCRKKEDILTVYLLDSSFSILALKKFLGEYVEFKLFNSIDELFFETSKCNYIILPFSNELISFLKNSNFQIINSIIIENKIFFLLSTYYNTIENDEDNIYILSENKINDSSFKSDDIFFSKIKRKKLNTLNLSYKIVGFSNN